MLTETEDTLTIADTEEIENESGYPPEIIAEWVRIGEETKAQLAAGEIFPMTAKEFAAQYGITIE